VSFSSKKYSKHHLSWHVVSFTARILAIRNRSHISCIHMYNTVRGGHLSNSVTLKSGLRVTQGHWKWNHWIDHIYYQSSYLSLNNYHGLEMCVRGHSRSLKMVLFNRQYTTFYWSAIVTIPLSCTIFEFYDIE